MQQFDIVIVGAGTAGLTAAIYALRAGKTVLVTESESFGGQITSSPRVENYPGIAQISGSEFADNLVSQAMELGAKDKDRHHRLKQLSVQVRYNRHRSASQAARSGRRK